MILGVISIFVRSACKMQNLNKQESEDGVVVVLLEQEFVKEGSPRTVEC